MGTDQNTTSLTGVGSPLGGTYQWQVGPRLSFQGPAMGQNVSIVGTGPSVSGMDTFVSVTYTVNGTSATASIRVTVEVPTQFVAENFPGGPGWTTTVTGTSSGYLTTMTYYIYAQGPLGQIQIEVPNITVTEVLQTISGLANTVLTPPDNIPKTGTSDLNGTVLDFLSAVGIGGLPGNFAGSRTQNWTLSGYALSPVNTINYGTTYATTSVQTFSH